MTPQIHAGPARVSEAASGAQVPAGVVHSILWRRARLSFALLPVAALVYFSFRMDAALDQALPGVLLGHRADVETSLLIHLPQVALEPLFDEMLRIIRYPHPLIGQHTRNWDQRLAQQIAQVQRAQGLDPDLLSGGPRPLESLFALKTSSLDEFGKAIDMALIGGYSGPRDAALGANGISHETCIVRELFAQAYGDRAAHDAMWPSE